MSIDPFAKLQSTDATPADAVPAPTAPADASDYFSFVMTVEDESYELPTGFGDFAKFIKPMDKAWVPAEIVEAKIGTRDMRIVIARDKDGKPQVSPKKIKEVLDQGGVEEVVETTVDRFELELQLVADCYGERSRSYLLGVPCFDVKLAYKDAKGRKSLGFNKSAGQRLVAATRLTEPGQLIGRDQLPALAEKMVGKIVMVQIRHVPKDYTDAEPRVREDGSLIKAKVDQHGSFIKVTKDAEGTLVYQDGDNEGQPVNRPEGELIEFKGGWLIPDNSDEAVMVKDTKTTTRVFDNLQDDVAPVHAANPKTGEGEREISIVRLDGTQVVGKVTWNTIGQIAKRPWAPGTMAQAVLDGGELVTVNWVGTAWGELKGVHVLQVAESGELQFIPGSGTAPDNFTGDQSA